MRYPNSPLLVHSILFKNFNLLHKTRFKFIVCKHIRELYFRNSIKIDTIKKNLENCDFPKGKKMFTLHRPKGTDSKETKIIVIYSHF